MGDQKDGSLDLEKELSCSICTDVFYQPLTLLDCLHTFCGSCLREWFSWQASAATSEHPYTCPACRAAVRDTKPNATVTTLLDMFLKAHPSRGKSQAEKDEIAHTYKQGDNVMPAVNITQHDQDSEDERLLQDVQNLSLQDLDAPRSSTMRHRRRYHDEVHQSEHTSGAQQRRNLDHQSSLRSLLSASEPNSLALQENIMRQITNEGLLDGIDLNNLSQEQEEEITERIARAFRARQREDARHRRRLSPRDRPSTSADPDMNSHPSRPRRLDDLEDQPRRRHRRTSSQVSQTRVRSASAAITTHDPLHSPNLLQPANRSVTDLPLSTYDLLCVRERPHSNSTRRVTDLDYRHPDSPSPRALLATARPSSRRDLYLSWQSLQPSNSHTRNVTNHSTTSLQTLPSDTGPTNNSSPALPSFPSMRHSFDENPRPATSSVMTSSSILATPRPVVPSVSCASCEKSNIQHSLHYHCTKCSSETFDLCINCYRAAKGCLHWYGFGYAALARYERLAATSERQPSEHGKPHVLSARRYHPTSGLLEEGFFCEGCLSFADACYWHCDICNDGAWGFCNDCVQKAKHCTHPLQCVGRLQVPATSDSSFDVGHDTAQHLRPAPLNTTKSAFHFLTTSHTLGMSNANLPNAPEPSLYTILTPAVYCDICERSIAPSNTCFHCHACNDGNYDICNPCYRAMGSSGRMRPDAQDWRRCPRGHRMSIVGFEDREGGPRRLVVRDFAGGWALKEDGPDGAEAYRSGPAPTGQWQWKEEDGTPAIQTSAARQAAMNLVPPDGGVGLRTQALWSRFPAEGVPDELAFPRNAIVTEVEDINGDWYWGVYAGKKGLFPGNFVRII